MSFTAKHSPETKARALAMLRAGKKRKVDIARELNVPEQTITTWYRRDVRGVPDKKPAKKLAKKTQRKHKPSSATSYLAKQLEIVSKMLRAKLPELARFALTTTADGKATVEYTVRQMTEVSGQVKL